MKFREKKRQQNREKYEWLWSSIYESQPRDLTFHQFPTTQVQNYDYKKLKVPKTKNFDAILQKIQQRNHFVFTYHNQ